MQLLAFLSAESGVRKAVEAQQVVLLAVAFVSHAFGVLERERKCSRSPLQLSLNYPKESHLTSPDASLT